MEKLKWYEVCIHTTHEAQEPVTHVLEEAGVNGVVIEDPLDLIKERDTFFGEIYDLNPDKYPKEGLYIKFYLPSDDEFQQKLDHIKQMIVELETYHHIDLGQHDITLKEIEEEDWANEWKKYYKPVKISDKITIVPTWEQYDPSENELILELDPGMAFGTGTHPTTMQSVQALERYVHKDDTIIDVGCGSGVLSVAACLLGAQHSYAFDIDPVAISSTQSNADINHVSSKVIAKQNDLLHNVDMRADVIISNILAEIIVTFVDDAWKNLKDNGIFITAGIIQRKKEMVIDQLEATGFHILECHELKDWISIVAKK